MFFPKPHRRRPEARCWRSESKVDSRQIRSHQGGQFLLIKSGLDFFFEGQNLRVIIGLCLGDIYVYDIYDIYIYGKEWVITLVDV